MSESPRDGCNIISHSVHSSARLTCHSSIRRCNLFLHSVGCGQVLFLLWQVEHGRSDAVPFLGIAVNQRSSFCFLSLGSQTACNKRTYLETTVMWEPSTCEEVLEVETPTPVVWRESCQGALRFHTCREDATLEVGPPAPTAWIWQRWTAPGKTFLNFWSIKLWAKEKDCLKPLCIWVACYAARDD